MSTLPEELAPAVPDITVPLPVAAAAPEFDDFDNFDNLEHVETEPLETLPERHLRAVPPRRRRQPRFGLWIGSIVTAASLFLLVAFNVLMVQGQFQLDRIAGQRAMEQKEYARLRDRVAALGAPDEIVGKALSMGMVTSAGGPTFLHAPTAGATPPPRDDTATTQKDTRDVPLAPSP
jgi:hypothetical protein